MWWRFGWPINDDPQVPFLRGRGGICSFSMRQLGLGEGSVMRRIFLAALGALLLIIAFAESASAQRAWGYRGGGWGVRAVGIRGAGFYGRPYMGRGWGLYRPGWRAAGWGWRRPYAGYGWGSPWRRGWGWGAAGLVAGVTAASYYGYGYPNGYGYPYGYSTYPYTGYGYPSCGCGSGYGYGGYAYPAAYSGWGY
jgi:hypothetical protein